MNRVIEACFRNIHSGRKVYNSLKEDKAPLRMFYRQFLCLPSKLHKLGDMTSNLKLSCWHSNHQDIRSHIIH